MPFTRRAAATALATLALAAPFAASAQDTGTNTFQSVQAVKDRCTAEHPTPTNASAPGFYDRAMAAQKAYSDCVYEGKMALLPEVPGQCTDFNAKLSADANRACTAAIVARNRALSLLNSAEPSELEQALDDLHRAINAVPYMPGYVPHYTGRR